MYEYAARLERVIDGDTIVLTFDLGFDVRFTHTVRLYGINAPEHDTDEGRAATRYLSRKLASPHGRPVSLLVRTIKDRTEKYGRYLAVVFNARGVNVNDALVKAGHAKPYDGGKRTTMGDALMRMPLYPVNERLHGG